MTTITIDPNYGYVLLAATSTFIMNSLHTSHTGKYRKLAKVGYPAAYAPSSRTDNEAYLFNCAQRSHAHFIENQPTALAAMLIAGLKFPIISAALGAAWTVFRYVYMKGYTDGTANGKGRYKGLAFWVAQAGLLGLAGWTGLSMVMKW